MQQFHCKFWGNLLAFDSPLPLEPLRPLSPLQPFPLFLTFTPWSRKSSSPSLSSWCSSSLSAQPKMMLGALSMQSIQSTTCLRKCPISWKALAWIAIPISPAIHGTPISSLQPGSWPIISRKEDSISIFQNLPTTGLLTKTISLKRSPKWSRKKKCRYLPTHGLASTRMLNLQMPNGRLWSYGRNHKWRWSRLSTRQIALWWEGSEEWCFDLLSRILVLHFDCLSLILVRPLSAAQLSNQVKSEKWKMSGMR